MKAAIVWTALTVIYLVGAGGTWAALSKWYPEEDCNLFAEAATLTPMEAEGARAMATRCAAANTNHQFGRVVGAAAWPVVLPIQLGMRGDWGAR